MKFIPAGQTKDRRKYDAFYSCPNCKDEKGKNKTVSAKFAKKDEPKEGEKIIIDLLMDIQYRVKGIEGAIGNINRDIDPLTDIQDRVKGIEKAIGNMNNGVGYNN